MDIETVYQDTLNYLYSFVDYSLTRSFQATPDKFELGRMREFVAYLGHPEQQYPIIHVAGTKGKGSVAALCANALQSAGYRVGFYTSPHLHDYAERIRVNGQSIAHADLIALVEELRPVLGQFPKLTTFEITTGLAFLYFARQGATAAVIEVGLGGRLDATNVVQPAVSVITSLSLDHTGILGNTLAEIAGEKAGIIKPGVPVVSSPQKEEARLVLERVAAEQGAPLIELGRDYGFAPGKHSLEGQVFKVWKTSGQEVELSIPLLGEHQVENAASAYIALQVWQETGLVMNEAALRQGFSQVQWPGRFELLRRDPPIIVDSAHNRYSALKLRQTLDEYFPEKRVILIFGASEDKDIAGMFAELLPRVDQVIATRSFHPRAIEPEKLLDLAQPFGKAVHLIPEVQDALAEALRLAGEDTLVLAAGSIFIAAATRETWLKQFQAGN